MALMIPCRLLSGWWERLRGLLLTDALSAGTVLLSPCRSIHTFGMSYPIDVAFLSREGVAVLVGRRVAPGRVLSCRKAASVIERPSSGRLWPSEGEKVSLAIWQRTAVGEEADHEV
ncbi:MAG: DUF192 domain-containing protein [Atopobiaceae bacterium]|nr:DUF192 domain-containing protein [Atopobiaceae bacterium]MBR1829683.1 DUF192 domain-containing protein [Atopobiaceae bacterium]